MEQPPNSVPLQICPSCKRKSLMLNKASDQYECLNTECGDNYFRATVDKYNQQVAIEKNTLNELAGKKTRSWSGNQYYDPKRKKWRDGKQPKRISLGHNNWIWIPIAFIIVSVIITLVLNYFYPGTKFIIFGW